MKQIFAKIPFVYYLQIYKSIIWQPCCHDVQAAELSEMDLKFVINNKQMAFLQSLVSQQLLFYFRNIWIQWWMWHIVGLVKQIFGTYLHSERGGGVVILTPLLYFVLTTNHSWIFVVEIVFHWGTKMRWGTWNHSEGLTNRHDRLGSPFRDQHNIL